MTQKKAEKLKFASCTVLLALCLLVIVFFSASSSNNLIHLCYLPIILAACWWRWKSFVVPGSLIVTLIFMNIVKQVFPVEGIAIEAVMFTITWAVIGFMNTGSVASESAKETAGTDVWLRTKSGNVDAEYTAQSFTSGGAELIVSDSGDFTGRTRIEDELVASEERLHTFLDSSSDLVFLKDSQSRYLFVNKAFAIYLGKPAGDIIGKYEAEFLPREKAVEFRESDLKILSDKQTDFSTITFGENIFETIKFPVHIDNSQAGIGGIARDITDRKKTEDAIARSEERNKLISEVAMDYIFKVRVDEKAGLVVEYTSDNYGRITGRNVDEVKTSASWSKIIYEEDITKFHAFARHVVETGKPGELECRSYLRDVVRWVSIVVNPIVDASGKTVSIVGAVKDISARKKAEEELRLSKELLARMNERFRLAVSAARFGVWDWNIEENLLEWDDMMCELYGIDRADFDRTYERWVSMLHPDDRAATDAIVRVALSGLKNFNTAFRIKRKNDGAIRNIKAYGEAIGNEQGKFVRMTGINYDITDIKRAEEALLESEKNFRSIFESSTAGIALVSLEGRYLMVNPSFCEIFGYSSQDFLNSTFFDITHPDDIEASKNFMRAVLGGKGKNIRFKKRYIHNDGHTIWAEVSSAVVHYSDIEPLYFITHVTDITECKLSEERIKVGLEEKEVLIHEIHHRVKNNLQAIISLLDLRSEEVTDVKTSLFLKELEEQARTMSLVYEQLYQSSSLARIDMDQYLGQLSSHVLEAFGNARVIDITIDSPSLSLDVAFATPCGLIVNELVTNSLKYAFPGGAVRNPSIDIRLRRDGNTCVLSVRDNGIGLPAGFDVEKRNSMGLRLVNLWATHQLGGSFAISGEKGTSCTIRFEDSERNE